MDFVSCRHMQQSYTIIATNKLPRMMALINMTQITSIMVTRYNTQALALSCYILVLALPNAVTIQTKTTNERIQEHKIKYIW